MASWRCPHCQTPQLETARCWVCRRSTTSCASCKYFRKGVTLKLGYCAQDKHRSPLTGYEERPCWESSTSERFAVATPTAPAGPGRDGERDLWGAPKPPPVKVDRTVRATGMWSEPDSSASGQPTGLSHGGSVRTRQWGRVPGQPEPSRWLSGLSEPKPKPKGWG